jgi:hypothetical protein
MREQRMIFRTAEQRAAGEARHAESTRRLNYYIDRARAEVEAKGEPPRNLQHYIARAQAEAKDESKDELPLT